MTQALRSPGSTLKPFIYGLGFEDGFIHPETLIDDRPVRYGDYAPENFDLTFQGTVTVRKALQLSLNVPAVAVLDRVGASRLAARLAQAGARAGAAEGRGARPRDGARRRRRHAHRSGHALWRLARLGTTVPLRGTRRTRTASRRAPRRLMEPVAAWYVGNVLLGTPPPENAAGGRIAFKTGTSYGYRDAWAVGFDGKRTIGVWVGRPDGAPVPGLVGRTAAAPILFDAFARTGKLPARAAARPEGQRWSPRPAKLPPPLQRFRPGRLPGEGTEPRCASCSRRMARGSSWQRRRRQADPIALKIAGGVGPLTVLVNGMPLPPRTGRRTLFFEPDGPGFVRLTVIDAKGATDSVVVRVQ